MLDTLLNSLGINPMVLLLNGITFLVLLTLLNALFWKPMARHLDARRSEIESGYAVVDRTREEIEALRAEYQSRINVIEADARARILDTVKDAQAQREAALAAARADVEAALQSGLAAIEQDRARAAEGIRTNLAEVALNAVSKATGAPGTPVHKQLIDEYIRQSAGRS
jgi:F-type H+-transporting ATPase subunit b